MPIWFRAQLLIHYLGVIGVIGILIVRLERRRAGPSRASSEAAGQAEPLVRRSTHVGAQKAWITSVSLTQIMDKNVRNTP